MLAENYAERRDYYLSVYSYLMFQLPFLLWDVSPPREHLMRSVSE